MIKITSDNVSHITRKSAALFAISANGNDKDMVKAGVELANVCGESAPATIDEARKLVQFVDSELRAYHKASNERDAMIREKLIEKRNAIMAARTAEENAEEKAVFSPIRPALLPTRIEIVKRDNIPGIIRGMIAIPDLAKVPVTKVPAKGTKKEKAEKPAKEKAGFCWDENMSQAAAKGWAFGPKGDQEWLDLSRKWTYESPFAKEFLRAKEIDLLYRKVIETPFLDEAGSNLGSVFHAMKQTVESLLLNPSKRDGTLHSYDRTGNMYLAPGVFRKGYMVNSREKQEEIARLHEEARKRLENENWLLGQNAK